MYSKRGLATDSGLWDWPPTVELMTKETGRERVTIANDRESRNSTVAPPPLIAAIGNREVQYESYSSMRSEAK